jgi:hypothetical protein
LLVRPVEQAKVGYSTLKAWMKDVAFRDALRAARLEALTVAVSLMQCSAIKAIGVLQKALQARHAATRIKAADLFLNHLASLTEFIDIDDLAERLTQLEEERKAQKRGGNWYQ